MLQNNQWTKENLLSLYKLRNEKGKDYKEIANILGKTVDSTAIKYKRVDWDIFIDDPDAYMAGRGAFRKWNQIEMAKLYAFIKSGKSYADIAQELNRTYISVERKAQTTNWKAWQTVVGDPNNPEEAVVAEDKELIKKQLADALVLLSRHDRNRLDSITENEFFKKVNFDKENLPVKFLDIKKASCSQLDSLGFGNPEELKLNEGTYMIVGDSHGKFTKKEMFSLLKEVDNVIKPKKIIHVGHLLDDDNEISYKWGMFDNLVIVAKIEELKLIQEQRNKYNFKYDIVRGGIQLGSNLLVINQDIISDYVKTPINALDSQIFDERVIVNCHRLEWSQKCSENSKASYMISPGCVCEKHIVNTIKQIDFEDNKTIKQAFYGGFSKYRRMQHMFDYWTQGIIIVHVDSSGKHTIVPCVIRKIKNEYVTSYFDKIITGSGVKSPDKKIFINADMHSPNQDDSVLDIQEQICKDYMPNILVNVGDAHDYRSLNHHEMDKGITITKNILDESAQVYSSLKRMSNWAKEKHIIYGNHERFASDFVAKFPQFKQYLDIRFLCDVEALGYNITNLKDVLKIGPTKFVHGDLIMYGQTGNKLEKASRTFKGDVFIGHIHSPAIRFETYSVGLSGKLDQTYNEPSASTWIHGFGLCNQYLGYSFPTTIAIIDYKCNIGRKVYSPKSPKSWKMGKYKARIVYEGI